MSATKSKGLRAFQTLVAALAAGGSKVGAGCALALSSAAPVDWRNPPKRAYLGRSTIGIPSIGIGMAL
ncbi:Uncharacterised protein [Mycobacterium tuberculosis]|nr:Uncharacterised protein [Mycobacterium tuberculosis]